MTNTTEEEVDESDEGGVSVETGQSLQRQHKIKWIALSDYRKSSNGVGGISGGLFLLIFGGQQIGWGIGLPHFTDRLNKDQLDLEDADTIKYYGNIWFLFAILGAFLSICNVVGARKRWIYLLCSSLNIISAILLANFQIDHVFLFYARIFGGVSFGLCYGTLIKHAGDVSIAKTRGFTVGLIHFSIVLGILINAMIFAYKPATICPHFLNGIVGLLLTGLGILCNYLLTIESPFDLIKRKLNSEAIAVLAHLQSTTEDDQGVKDAFDEIEKMLEEEKKEIGLFVLSKSNFYPILLSFLLRLAFVGSFNYIINCLIVVDDLKITQSESVMVIGVRLAGVLLGLFTVDLNRGWHFIGILVTGIVAIVLAGTAYILPRESYLNTAPALTIIFLFLSGLHVGPLVDVYTTEVFSNAKKQTSIILLIIIELGIQSLIFVEGFNLSFNSITIQAFAYAFIGFYLLGVGLKLFLVGPETSQVSLREARNKFDNRIFFG